MNTFNPENYTDTALRIRIKLREKQIYELKQQLGITEEPFEQLANELGCTDFSNKLKQWKKETLLT
jgi:hypothetical protein